MKRYLLVILLLVLGITSGIYAQNRTMQVTGTVKDNAGEPLIGTNISVKNASGLGVITDMDGKYTIKIPPYSTLIFSYIGYDSKEILVKENMLKVDVVLQESSESVLDEVVITGTGAQKKITVTGAVTTVNVEDLKSVPSSSITNALAGNVPGIMARQTSGQPGKNTSEFWIRGISTFGANTEALVLVDGFERSMDEINVEDIESFSVLKDASATAIYGSRGANGVVLITTKRGKAGKVNINAKVESSYSARTYTPKFVDGYTYANLLNESLVTRYKEPMFSQDDLYLFKNGLDPDLYPNVDWMDILLKDGAMSYRANIDISGGGETARYFVSASYIDEGGMYKVDKALKDYDTNANYRRWNYRMNVDIDITRTTLLKLGMSGWLSKQNESGFGEGQIWAAAMNNNPIAIPPMYSDGKVASAGENDRANPWMLATQGGYIETWDNTIQTNVVLEQDLKFITKGLKFTGRFGFDTKNKNIKSHRQWPEQWKAERERDSNGNIVYRKLNDEKVMYHEGSSSGTRKEFFEAILNYNRTFGDHQVGGTMKYTQDQTTNTTDNSGYNWLSRKHQGLAGRFTYGWKYRYFFDFNFGYNGSENFASGKQFGFFPAYSVAWNIAEEPLIKKKLQWMNMFKVRYSYGKVGSDYVNGVRFPFLATFQDNGSYNWGDYNNSNSYNGLMYKSIASDAITWEIATKHDVGVDISLWNDKISATVDYFHETRDGIYMSRRSLPDMIGLQGIIPAANVGKIRSTGFDGNAALHHKFNKVSFTLRGNFTYSKNTVLEADENYSVYPYRMQRGYRVSQNKGYIALGLFKDYDDIRNSPYQGDVMPGDIKYKDINSDGVINSNDHVPIGSTTRPNFVYGFGLSASWRNFDANVHFQGTGQSTFLINGQSVYAFSKGDWGNILQDMVDSGYWSLGENEDPNAKYPRLSYGGNANNYQGSSYWLRDGSYLRLKTLEVGYTLPKNITRLLRMNNVRIFFIGNNLLTFSDFKLWDPEMGSSTGQGYPLTKSCTLGLTIKM